MSILASDTVQTTDGTVVSEVRWLDDGTVEFYEAGRLVRSRRQTADEAERFAPPAPTPDDRLAALEEQNAALLAALAKATTLAQIRAAATDLA